MNQELKKAQLTKIYETWMPRLEKHLKDKGLKVNENRLKEIAVMAHARKLYENTATLSNTPGRGAFSFGNNPMNQSDTTLGSAEMFQKLFGVFVDTAAQAVALDLLPMIPMVKSNVNVVVAEPVYAGGKKESATDRPMVFQVKWVKNGTGINVVAGSTYEIKSATDATDFLLKVEYVGKHQYNGNLIFKLIETGSTVADKTLAEILDSDTTNAGIYSTAANYISFKGETVDYVNGFTNFIAGYTGAGMEDSDSWHANRNDGKSLYSPMDRETGEATPARMMGGRMWSKNFAAQTFQVGINFTTEQIQDAKMDHDFDMLEFGDTILQDSLAQSMNNHFLSHIFAAGWEHHWKLNQLNGLNFNTFLGASNETGKAQQFVDLQGVARTIDGAPGVLPATGAIAENLSTLQRRIITRMFWGSTVIKQRGRTGKGDTSVMNGTNSTAVCDIKGFTISPFENNLNMEDTVSKVGTFFGIGVYEDALMDLTDGRISVFKKGDEKRAGLKFCPYILAEKLEAVVEGTMQKKMVLKSRYALAQAGSHPEANYLTFVVQQGEGYSIV